MNEVLNDRSKRATFITMPWETQFNVEETLEKALNVFWEFGYNATSMRDLTKSMKINSGSIYSTFGNKRQLFLSALEHYNRTSEQRLKKLEQMPSAKTAIIRFFENVRDMTLDGTDANGCFVVNTTLEMAPHDKEMSDLVTKGQNILRKFFKKLIEKGQSNGEFSHHLDAENTSELLLGLLLGVRVLTRNNPTKKQFNVIIGNVDSILSS